MTDTYGLLVSRSEVERAILGVLKAWAPDYLAAIGQAARNDRASLQRVRSWRRVSRFPDQAPDEQLPYVAIVSTGTTDAPLSDGDTYSARLAVAVGVLVSAGGENAEENARDLAADYGLALATALVHKGITSPLIDDVSWRTETAADGPRGDDTLATSIHAFWVDVPDVMSRYGGPTTPSSDPVEVPPDLGQVEEVDITIDTETPS